MIYSSFCFFLKISIYLPIMSNPCWGLRHVRVKLQEY